MKKIVQEELGTGEGPVKAGLAERKKNLFLSSWEKRSNNHNKNCTYSHIVHLGQVEIPFTPEAKKILENCVQEASKKSWGCQQIGTLLFFIWIGI